MEKSRKGDPPPLYMVDVHNERWIDEASAAPMQTHALPYDTTSTTPTTSESTPCNEEDALPNGNEVHSQWTPRKNPTRSVLDDEDRLLKYIVHVNQTYEDVFKKPAPFMTFVMVGLQSSGKSSLVERFLGHVLNIVDEGTATRCPLDITVLHDDLFDAEPSCDLVGQELENPGEDLSVKDVFERITTHNKRLKAQGRVSKEPLKLVFRSNKVQNMRLVDIPGLKDNKDSNSDDRNAIQSILRHEMKKPNTKLCVLLQSTEEFATQPIIRRCDEIFGNRREWVGRAVFVMTKGDLLMTDKRSHGSVNRFFRAFHENGIFPHLICNPKLDDQNSLTPQEVYEARQELLLTANESEEKRFIEWENKMNQRVHASGEQGWLDEEIKQRFGFDSAQKLMRIVLLEDTHDRLPQVRLELCHQQDVFEQERDNLERLQKLEKVETLKPIVMKVIREIEDAVNKQVENKAYTTKNTSHEQDLYAEIKSEMNSEWAKKRLNNTGENEWRHQIEQLIDSQNFPDFIQARVPLIGGAQIRRVIDLFRLLLEQSFIDSHAQDKHRIINAVGFLSNGVMAPDYGQAIKQIIESHVRESIHPGINYVVKHAGGVYRRLIHQSFESVKRYGSSDCSLLPRSVQTFILREFDEMLWEHLKVTADSIGMAVEPMGPKAERVSEQDADAILAEAFVYHDRLIELLLATVRFQMSYHLVIGVKKMLRESFDKIILKADWANLVQQDPNLQKAIEQTDEKLRRIDESIGKLDQLLY